MKGNLDLAPLIIRRNNEKKTTTSTLTTIKKEANHYSLVELGVEEELVKKEPNEESREEAPESIRAEPRKQRGSVRRKGRLCGFVSHPDRILFCCQVVGKEY